MTSGRGLDMAQGQRHQLSSCSLTIVFSKQKRGLWMGSESSLGMSVTLSSQDLPATTLECCSFRMEVRTGPPAPYKTPLPRL